VAGRARRKRNVSLPLGPERDLAARTGPGLSTRHADLDEPDIAAPRLLELRDQLGRPLARAFGNQFVAIEAMRISFVRAVTSSRLHRSAGNSCAPE